MFVCIHVYIEENIALDPANGICICICIRVCVCVVCVCVCVY